MYVLTVIRCCVYSYLSEDLYEGLLALEEPVSEKRERLLEESADREDIIERILSGM